MSRNRLIEAVGSANVEAPAASPCSRSGRVCLACGCDLEPVRAESGGAVGRVGPNPWFATPKNDGRYLHWQRGGVQPPRGRRALPGARRVSSADALVVDARWRRSRTPEWGRDNLLVGARLAGGPTAAAAARGPSAARAWVAAHIEPYRGRRSPRPRLTSPTLAGSELRMSISGHPPSSPTPSGPR